VCGVRHSQQAEVWRSVDQGSPGKAPKESISRTPKQDLDSYQLQLTPAYRGELIKYIENFYSRKKPRNTLGYKTHEEVGSLYRQLSNSCNVSQIRDRSKTIEFLNFSVEMESQKSEP